MAGIGICFYWFGKSAMTHTSSSIVHKLINFNILLESIYEKLCTSNSYIDQRIENTSGFRLLNSMQIKVKEK